LFERSAELGGLLPLAALAPGKRYIADLNQYLATQLVKLRVDIRLNTQASADAVRSLKPDVVILATGAEPSVPDIPGLTGGLAKGTVVQAIDVLAGEAEVGERVVVLGGALVGCETAEILAAKGKKVTVTRRGPDMATGLSFPLRQALLGRLSAMGVVLRPSVRYEALRNGGLVITNADGRTETIPADTIVLAAGSKPRIELFKLLEVQVPEIRRVGDCVEARGIREAIHEGSRVGRL
jgi:pyruvate/2-oxoglutarate dehydrogenase complex dihydrolipoamide dehydrogenase (E3) component